MKSNQSPLERYIAGAIKHGEGGKAADPDRANAGYHELIAALKDLRLAADSGRQALAPLLQHENAFVRCWSATHLLKLAPKDAAMVLRDLAQGYGLVSFTAETVLEEWSKGRLNTP